MRVVWRRLAMNSGRRDDGTVNTHNTALLSVYCQIGRHTNSRAKAWSEGNSRVRTNRKAATKLRGKMLVNFMWPALPRHIAHERQRPDIISRMRVRQAR